MIQTIKEMATNRDLFMILIGAGMALGIRWIVSGIVEAIITWRSNRRRPFDKGGRR